MFDTNNKCKDSWVGGTLVVLNKIWNIGTKDNGQTGYYPKLFACHPISYLRATREVFTRTSFRNLTISSIGRVWTVRRRKLFLEGSFKLNILSCSSINQYIKETRKSKEQILSYTSFLLFRFDNNL